MQTNKPICIVGLLYHQLNPMSIHHRMHQRRRWTRVRVIARLHSLYYACGYYHAEASGAHYLYYFFSFQYSFLIISILN